MEGKTVSAGRLLHAVKPPGCRIRSGLETFKFFQNDFLRKRRKLRSCFLQLQDSGEIAPGLIDGCQLCVDAAVIDMTGNCKFQQLACLIGISGITQFLGIDGSISFKCGKRSSHALSSSRFATPYSSFRSVLLMEERFSIF